MKGCFAAFSRWFFVRSLIFLVEKQNHFILSRPEASFKVKRLLTCCSGHKLCHELINPSLNASMTTWRGFKRIYCHKYIPYRYAFALVMIKSSNTLWKAHKFLLVYAGKIFFTWRTKVPYGVQHSTAHQVRVRSALETRARSRGVILKSAVPNRTVLLSGNEALKS